MRITSLLVLLSTLFILSSPQVNATRIHYQDVLKQMDNSGRYSITGNERARHSSSANGVSVIDNHTGKQIFHEEYGKNEGRVFNFAMSPSGKYFGYWAEKYPRKGFFYVYQRSPLKLLHKIPSPNSWDWDRGAEFSVSEKRLYLQSYTNSLVVDVDSGKTLQLFKGVTPSHDDFKVGAITPDDQKLVVSREKSLNVWDISTGKLLLNTFDRKNHSGRHGWGQIRFNKAGTHYLSAWAAGFVMVNIETGKITYVLEDLASHSDIMADFIADERLPLVTFISGRGGYHDEADAQRLKAPTPGIYLYDMVKKKVVSRLGDKDDNYQEARKKADYLVSEERVEELQAQNAQLNNLQGEEQLEQYALLFTALSNGNTTYVTAINTLLAQTQKGWLKASTEQVALAQKTGNAQHLITLAEQHLLEPQSEISFYQRKVLPAILAIYQQQKDYQGLLAMLTLANLPATIADSVISSAVKYMPESLSLNERLEFVNKFADNPATENVIADIYKEVEKAESIAAYLWFSENLPDSKQAKAAIRNMHQLAFELAESVDTVAAYNDFIIAYPWATQAQEANELARALENDEYSSFFSSDDELSRRLLVRSKQIARKAKQQSYDTVGYLLIIERMNTLLQDNFPGAEATLRYLESEEFKDFHRDFNRAMKSLETRLDDINKSVGKLNSFIQRQSDTMNAHFDKAAQDREMASELTRQHRLWERYLQKQE